MVTLLISDIHSRYDNFESSKLPDAEVLLIGGDITNLGLNHIGGDVYRSNHWMSRMAQKYPKIFYVFGNHDIKMNKYQYSANDNVYCITNEYSNLPNDKSIYGVSLSTCYNIPNLALYWDHMTAKEDVEEAAFDFNPVDIVLSHSPPYNCLDMAEERFNPKEDLHLGSKYLRSYINRHRPKLVVCGHCHKQNGYEKIKNTLVVNVAEKWSLLDITDKEIKIEQDNF